MEYNDSETSNSFNNCLTLKIAGSTRLLVAEKLYPLFPTTEYRDIPLKTVSDWAEREMIRRHVNYKRSTLNLSDKTQKISKSRKPNGNSKRFKKRKLIESNNEINEEGQQASGPTLSTKNCEQKEIPQVRRFNRKRNITRQKNDDNERKYDKIQCNK
ncbi:hypothetical protein GLOIN_2v1788884 [Rhizophagus irregularis DAOM 181602=DAOM 197198]|uniref:Uncharacterized protein n=1 Tax=Rhizophagus irregularis (strain DAOM 181602 / DAOM 197198 / MUCL 43194) TaxID=747089 RepID=A0A2P4P2R7_RHIID|nr:hypothetical protein GLOIN_2v1788884 [Rhizophagus irregularis DAOM 181602=DAOM 197198]POG59648.1 hypothetical protein GLOIN_2v1788884 [Rhizophagus irregularis DAOM 181602=DAOM 197198]|eukprot:XP_025166514.1 hypothetical protein GLOIN_2v1788884 [Rhizophagus irregularis DAOM 181602=DAOM 197198]